MNEIDIFPWNENFYTGIAIIDEQHHVLVKLINRLACHIAFKSDPIQISQVFKELSDYTAYHFSTEEKIWDAVFGDENSLARHKETHKGFIDSVEKIRRDQPLQSLDEAVAASLEFLARWLASHILESDRYMAFVVLSVQSGAPLQEAKQVAAQKMSGGTRLLIELVISIYGTLSANTLRLMQELNEHKRIDAELLALNATLEERISQRTQELTQTNAALLSAMNALKLAQAELVKSEKLASLGTLVAGVAHELNTPIGNTLLVASALNQRSADFAKRIDQGIRRTDLATFVADVSKASEALTTNIERSASLVASFKRVAVDQREYSRRVFDLLELVHEVTLSNAIRPLLAKKSVSFQLDVPAAVQIDSWPHALEEILIGLIKNSVEHGLAGRDGTIRVTAEVSAERVKIHVIDTGRGIRAEDLPHLFEPFYASRLTGTGVGLELHIAHALVTRLLGGQIEVQSSSHGTCVTLDIPSVAG